MLDRIPARRSGHASGQDKGSAHSFRGQGLGRSSGRRRDEEKCAGLPAGAADDAAPSLERELATFLILAFVVLPALLFGAVAAYGFVVWFLQILYLGPPT
ncbi:MAG: periplasmic nitrate reductase, NapE protein [Geminicoccaceae bacterium]